MGRRFGLSGRAWLGIKLWFGRIVLAKDSMMNENDIRIKMFARGSMTSYEDECE